MKEIDFTKAPVGTRVKCPMYGCGVISKIMNEDPYCVFVNFSVRNISYTSDGRIYDEPIDPTLCFDNGSIKIDQGSPPPARLVFKGKPVWAMVNHADDIDLAVRRRVVACGTSGFQVVFNGEGEFDANAVTRYEYAWECEQDVIEGGEK